MPFVAARALRIYPALAGAFPGNPIPHDVNGSLWTLPAELRLYIAVLAAGMVGLLARRVPWFAVL